MTNGCHSTLIKLPAERELFLRKVGNVAFTRHVYCIATLGETREADQTGFFVSIFKSKHYEGIKYICTVNYCKHEKRSYSNNHIHSSYYNIPDI